MPRFHYTHFRGDRANSAIANPALTIMAPASRLADRMKALASGRAPRVLGRVGVLVPLACAALIAGCGGGQSTLNPRSRAAHDVTELWWWMLAVASLVFFGAVFMLTTAWLRRRREGLPFLGQREGLAHLLVILFGIAIPVVILAGVFAVANLVVIKDTEAPAAGTTRMTVKVIGHQWFWEVRYPGTTAITANEIHIPTRTRVTAVVNTADVIHSFWVPELNRKIDMIPGQTGRILLYADRPGDYRGQCAEFCGVQHAKMGMRVFAESPPAFRGWLANEARPVRRPSTVAARRGEQVFLANACADCHTLRGTPAHGTIGPDLTHMASRKTLAALAIPNNPSSLASWIRDPQHPKPGNRMPGLDLSRADVDALVAYLEGLR